MRGLLRRVARGFTQMPRSFSPNRDPEKCGFASMETSYYRILGCGLAWRFAGRIHYAMMKPFHRKSGTCALLLDERRRLQSRKAPGKDSPIVTSISVPVVPASRLPGIHPTARLGPGSAISWESRCLTSLTRKPIRVRTLQTDIGGAIWIRLVVILAYRASC